MYFICCSHRFQRISGKNLYRFQRVLDFLNICIKRYLFRIVRGLPVYPPSSSLKERSNWDVGLKLLKLHRWTINKKKIVPVKIKQSTRSRTRGKYRQFRLPYTLSVGDEFTEIYVINSRFVALKLSNSNILLGHVKLRRNFHDFQIS